MTIRILALFVAIGIAFVLRVAIKSYRDEASDYKRAAVPAISSRPQSAGIGGLQEVRFGPDAMLAGWYVPSRNRAAIVLAHGTGADRSSLLPEIRILAAAGFGVLALDFPGQGASAGEILWGKGERDALVAAIDWLGLCPEIDAARIGGFGLSFGGYILVQTAATETRFRAIALASTPADIEEEVRLASSRWGLLSELPAVWALKRSGMPIHELKPREIIGSIAPRAVFVLGGEFDNWVPQATSKELFSLARDPRQLWIVPGAGHGNFADVAPEEYADRLARFFADWLLR